jgi:hypothetical protein
MSKLMDSTALSLTMILVVEGKGGTGKSLIAQVCAAMIRDQKQHSRLLMVDTDSTNSSTKSIEADAEFAEFGKDEIRGVFVNVIAGLRSRTYDNVVVDTGARDEKHVIKILPWLSKALSDIGADLIVVRPITLSSQVQRNAVAFVLSTRQLALKTIFVRNLGQGREPEEFEYWHSTKARAEALAAGAVECEMPDAGAHFADEAGGFGLSLADVALGNFSKAGEDADAASRAFNKNDQAWLSIWLDEQILAFRSAIAAAGAS